MRGRLWWRQTAKRKYVYDFAEGNKDLKDLLGGKGANLAEMTNLGLPVPPGFTITTEACRAYLRTGREPDGLAERGRASTSPRWRSSMGKRLGDPADPLLVSVRSGAKFSMPGMMETVLNVGLTDEQRARALAAQAGGNERFAWDSYRRLIQMFGRTVCGVPGEEFEQALDEAKQRQGHHATTSTWTPTTCARWSTTYKKIFAEHTGREFPQDPREQLDLADPRRSSSRGTPSARCCTAGRSASRPTSAPRSTWSPWSSATSAPTPAPAWRSPATRPPARRASTATTWPTRRARTWSPASATPCRCRSWSGSTSAATTS